MVIHGLNIGAKEKEMKNYREKYIKVAKGNKYFGYGLGRTVGCPEWWDFADTKPVFVVKNGGKKK